MASNRLWQITFCFIASMFVLSSNLSAVEPAAFEPDHYLSYDIKAGPYSSERVTLTDQFIGPMDFVVRRPTNLLNPTVKRHNNRVFEIKNPILHYTAYEIRPLGEVNVSESVVVINQFGSFLIEKFKPSHLLVPARKWAIFASGQQSDEHSQALFDHYLCYDIPAQTVSTQGVFVKDQFRSREFDSLVASRLCNPVSKLHDGRNHEIINDSESNHLMCFEFSKKRILRLVKLLDQFGLKKAVAYSDGELCVPSIKLRVPDDRCDGSLPGDDGICEGTCPTPSEKCTPDFAAQTCRCQPQEPTLCSDETPGSDGQCNGICPPDQRCTPLVSANRCECLPITPLCGFTPNGVCGGSCPEADEQCMLVPGTNECGCIIG